jgi:hypothetical protein
MKFKFYFSIIAILLVSNIESSTEDNEQVEDLKLLKDFLNWLKYYLKSKHVRSEQNSLV